MGLRRFILKSHAPSKHTRSNMIRDASVEHFFANTKGLHDHRHSSCSPLPLVITRRLLRIRTSARPIHPHAADRRRNPIAARLRRYHRQRNPPPRRLFRFHPPHHHPPHRRRNESPATLAATTRTILQRRTLPIRQR